MTRAIVSTAMLVTLFLGGCDSNSGAPQAAIDAAINAAKQSPLICRDVICEKFSAPYAKKRDLTAAQKLNNSQIYDIGLDFVIKTTEKDAWRDSWTCLKIVGINDNWSEEGAGSCNWSH